MAQINISKNVTRRPMLTTAGEYGPGRQHEAEVVWFDFEFPATEDNAPGYDRDLERIHAFFLFKVTPHGQQSVFVRHWEEVKENSGSKIIRFLQNLGVGVTETPDGEEFTFDDDEVKSMIPKQIAGIEVGDTRPAKNGNVYPSKVFNVLPE
jgi:hypothetical protein